MLKVTIAADADDGTPEQQYEFNQNKLMASEASMLQRYTGRTIQEWQEGMKKGDVDCMIGLVWLAMKRSGSVVQYQDVDFNLSGVDIVDLDAKKGEAEEAEAEASGDPTPLSPSSDVEESVTS